MATTTFTPARAPQISRLQTIGLGAAVIGILLLAAGFFVNKVQFFESYLFGFYFIMSLPIGCLGALLVQHLTGGAWGVTVRRMLEAGALAMPVMGLLSIPVILATYNVVGLPEPIYEWANAELVAHDPILLHKQPWLSPNWFTSRIVIYFVIWSTLALILRAWSLRQDRTGNQAMTKNMQMISGIGVALFVVSVTFFAFDWSMSLAPHWYSTMFGAHYIASSVLFTLSFLVLVLTQVRHIKIFHDNVTIKPIHDIGKLMLAFTVLWTYMSYGQFVIIWSGDLAESTPWFKTRLDGGWLPVAITLMFVSFFVPFFLLLSRRLKKNLNSLATIATLIIVMRFLDASWITLPAFHPNITEISWMDFAAPLGLFGIFLSIFATNLQRAQLLPLNDPNMELLHAGGHH